MKVLQFYTTGRSDIVAHVWDKPDPTDNQIEVKSLFTGVCSSDVAMYKGEFTLLPIHMHGHEGLGCVTAIGANITDVAVGDIVATRGEPAFAECYNAELGTYVKVPSADPAYIIEPIACAVNIARSVQIQQNHSVAILGTGFLAKIVYQLIKGKTDKIVVVGSANSKYWTSEAVNQLTSLEGSYDIVYDLSDKPQYVTANCINENGTYVLAAEKKPSVTTSFANWLWKNVSIVCPSPRDPRFHSYMLESVELISSGALKIDGMWNTFGHTKLQVSEAFAAAANREYFGKRLYINWTSKA